MDKIPVKGDKKWKSGGGKTKGRARDRGEEAGRPTMCSCSLYPQPHPYPHPHSRPHTSHSKRGATVLSHSQEELLPHCHSFSGVHVQNLCLPNQIPVRPNQAANLTSASAHSPQTIHHNPHRRLRSSPPCLPPPSRCPSHLALLILRLTTSRVGMAGQGQAQASASAKLQYQRLRSVPQPRRFYSPHLPLKAKSLCSRRGSAHFSSLESEV
ncbi:uncharacterized protein LOC117822448 [Notolabrus celidotus]|uniref:uncharacterized protein LOC117822448 n=1 Tax=Notolabrus celidotus TaxID=1203425 RepID=UPI00148F900E|nr:uncharacterized protein LOC117822448 [Notolabrus celidotus]XP_034553060.1 uncharacterized protein LOC117822448 [Notolabrus celidotus]XP_034553061.1 uncharacterized protein LOC117822448 [Notolabrus celidotus]XP_034553062.1 uncharacterized protein LOC117822448 [Notolabrus celidotus]